MKSSSASDRSTYDEVYIYTIGRPGFILQHVVDAYAVQGAGETSKPMGIIFGLAGLYLHVERHFTGHQVQQAHSKLARERRSWPKIELPEDRGAITVGDVARAAAGPERDRAIDDWCRSVWSACNRDRQQIVAFLSEYGIA